MSNEGDEKLSLLHRSVVFLLSNAEGRKYPLIDAEDLCTILFCGVGGGGATAFAVGAAEELRKCLLSLFPFRGGETENISSIPSPWNSISLFLSPALGGQSGYFRGQLL